MPADIRVEGTAGYAVRLTTVIGRPSITDAWFVGLKAARPVLLSGEPAVGHQMVLLISEVSAEGPHDDKTHLVRLALADSNFRAETLGRGMLPSALAPCIASAEVSLRSDGAARMFGRTIAGAVVHDEIGFTRDIFRCAARVAACGANLVVPVVPVVTGKDETHG